MVAMPFSTVSGVLFGSCDPSLGAIFVARVLTTNYLKLTMRWSVFGSLLDESVLKEVTGLFATLSGYFVLGLIQGLGLSSAMGKCGSVAKYAAFRVSDITTSQQVMQQSDQQPGLYAVVGSQCRGSWLE